MLIEINPTSLNNLKNICEVLYKLHPYVLDRLIQMERIMGNVLGTIDLTNMSLEEREFLTRSYEEEEPVSIETMEDDEPVYNYIVKYVEEDIKTKDKSELLKKIQELKEDNNARKFDNLRTYIQLDTYEYIPIKISVEVEDPVIGRKVKELVKALEKTRAPEQFYYNKKEMDEDAYFAEGYGLQMNEEQKKEFEDFFYVEDVEGLERLLREKKLYP